jgi:hypothetical protein
MEALVKGYPKKPCKGKTGILRTEGLKHCALYLIWRRFVARQTKLYG